MNNIQKAFRAKEQLGMRRATRYFNGGQLMQTTPSRDDPAAQPFAPDMIVNDQPTNLSMLRRRINAMSDQDRLAANAALSASTIKGPVETPAPAAPAPAAPTASVRKEITIMTPERPAPAPRPAINPAFQGIDFGPYGTFHAGQGMRTGFARGGEIDGPGTGTSDSIKASSPHGQIHVSDGEYILPVKTVEALGKENIDALVHQTTGQPPNNAGLRRGYATGGPITIGGPVRMDDSDAGGLMGFGHGLVKSFGDTALSLGQMATPEDSDVGRGIQKMIDERKSFYAPNDRTVGGMAGNLTGQVAQTILPAGKLMLGANAARKAVQATKGATKAARSLAALRQYGTAAGVGGGIGLITTPTASDESTTQHALMGALGGGLGQAAGNVIGAGVQGLRNGRALLQDISSMPGKAAESGKGIWNTIANSKPMQYAADKMGFKPAKFSTAPAASSAEDAAARAANQAKSAAQYRAETGQPPPPEGVPRALPAPAAEPVPPGGAPAAPDIRGPARISDQSSAAPVGMAAGSPRAAGAETANLPTKATPSGNVYEGEFTQVGGKGSATGQAVPNIVEKNSAAANAASRLAVETAKAGAPVAVGASHLPDGSPSPIGTANAAPPVAPQPPSPAQQDMGMRRPAYPDAPKLDFSMQDNDPSGMKTLMGIVGQGPKVAKYRAAVGKAHHERDMYDKNLQYGLNLAKFKNEMQKDSRAETRAHLDSMFQEPDGKGGYQTNKVKQELFKNWVIAQNPQFARPGASSDAILHDLYQQTGQKYFDDARIRFETQQKNDANTTSLPFIRGKTSESADLPATLPYSPTIGDVWNRGLHPLDYLKKFTPMDSDVVKLDSGQVRPVAGMIRGNDGKVNMSAQAKMIDDVRNAGLRAKRRSE